MTMEGSAATNIIVIYTVAMREGRRKWERGGGITLGAEHDNLKNWK